MIVFMKLSTNYNLEDIIYILWLTILCEVGRNYASDSQLARRSLYSLHNPPSQLISFGFAIS